MRCNAWYGRCGYVPVEEVLGKAFSQMNDWLGTDFAIHRPAVNIAESSDAWRIELSAPGFVRENFELQIKDQYLIVRGKKDDNKAQDWKYIRIEFKPIDFVRKFKVPQGINTEEISATYQNGILTILMPKLPESRSAKSRNIQVE